MIELTNAVGSEGRISLVIERIQRIEEVNNGTRVVFDSGSITVKESYDDILTLLAGKI